MMNKPAILIFSFSVMLSVFGNHLSAQTVTGYVTDAVTGHALQGVVLAAFSDKETTFFETGINGYYSFELYPGSYNISVTRRGYDDRLLENVKLSYDQTLTLDIRLNPQGYKPPELQPQKQATERPVVEQTDRVGMQVHRDQTITRHSSTAKQGTEYEAGRRFNLSVGYQFGQLGGISGGVGVPVGNWFGTDNFHVPLFITLSAGHEQKSYKSIMFNDVNTPRKFGFTRADAGAQLLFTVNKVLIGSELSLGIEQAKPMEANINQLIDDGYLSVFFFKPTLNLGVLLSQSMAVFIEGNYYLMSENVRLKDGKIVAQFDDKLNRWSAFRYDSDFFKNRNGITLEISLRVMF